MKRVMLYPSASYLNQFLEFYILAQCAEMEEVLEPVAWYDFYIWNQK